MSADGTNPTRITFNAAIDGQPTWSPDGARIAFTSGRDGNYEIYAMNADGTNPTRLTHDLGVDEEPAWQPVPEPRELAFLLAGSSGLAWFSRHRRLRTHGGDRIHGRAMNTSTNRRVGCLGPHGN